MLPTLEDALKKIAELERRIAKLERIILGSSTVSIKSPLSADEEHSGAPLPKLDKEWGKVASGSKTQAEPICIQSAIEENFPKIADKLTLVWGHPECLAFLSKLIIDQRGNRKGFNPEVMNELILLVEITEQISPASWAEFVKLGNRR